MNDLSDIPSLDSLKLIDHFEKGAVLFDSSARPVVFNETILTLFPALTPGSDFFSEFTIYTQKRSLSRFNLYAWLQNFHPQTDQQRLTSEQLWLKSPNSRIPMPVTLDLHKVRVQERDHLLMLVTDKSLERQFFAQRTLINAAYSGQFITDSHGFIVQPNQAFCAYTGLNASQLEKLTYIDWLKKQVSFRIPFDQVMSALLKDHFWTGEVQIFPGPETQFSAVLNISMLVDKENNIEHFIGVLQDQTDLYEAQSEINHLSYYDQLTGLGNRHQLDSDIKRSIEACRSAHEKKEPTPFYALLFVGLDGFKIINDTFGHKLGDELLKEVSRRLQAQPSENVKLFRLDGSHFALHQTSPYQDRSVALEYLWQLASQVLQTIEGRYKLNGHSVHSSASIGACLYPLEDMDQYSHDQLTSFADMAMHEANKRGGNQVYLFDKSLVEQAQNRLQLIEALNHSELDNEFQVYFQPQMDQHQKVVSAETLIRWFHPELGTIPPSKFIPVAEEGRQIIKIGLWVLHKAFLQVKAWNKIDPNFRISVNISPVQFHEQSFVEIIIGLVKFTQVKASNITLELTEGVLIKNAKLALQKIQHLVSLGFEISIDDFGTGYSSLSYLQKLPIHELKIDQSFISHLIEDSDEAAIVDSIIQLGQSKQLKLVAEGVETAHQMHYLISKAPDILLQGFYFAKPQPADSFEKNFILGDWQDEVANF